MPKVAARDIMEVASIAGYGVALVEPDSTELAQAALDAALAEEAPVALAVARDADPAFIAELVQLCDKAQVPAYVHALAGNSTSPKQLADLGVGALAVDFSGLSPEENLSQTRAAVEEAKTADLWTQAALGWAGLDFDPEKGASFARDSGCNVLGVDPGTGPLAIETLLGLANRLITFPLAVDDPVTVASNHEQGQPNWLTRAAHMGLCQANFTQQMRQARDQGGIEDATGCLRELMRAMGSKGRW